MKYVLTWIDQEGQRNTALGSAAALATKLGTLVQQGLTPTLTPANTTAVVPGSVSRSISGGYPFVVLSDGHTRRYAPVTAHQTAEEQWDQAVDESLLTPMLEHSKTLKG